MKVVLVPSAVGSAGNGKVAFLTSYIINDTIAIDAGGLGLFGSPQDQSRITDVFISHTHMDHIATLPIFVENIYEGKRDSVTIHGAEPVLTSLREDVFNDRIWPDFIALSKPEAPFMKFARLIHGEPVLAGSLRITPIPMNHVISTCGFLVEEDGKSVVIASDTGPTEAIWAAAGSLADLRGIFLEATFPVAMKSLAEVTKHLTPELFAGELLKVDRDVQTIAVHIKARYHEQVARELTELHLPQVEIGRPGAVYRF